MKKEVTKKKSTGFKPRHKKRQCLLEIPYNSIEARHPLKKRTKSIQVFELLPSELILSILEFLNPSELVTSCQLVSKYWQTLVSAPILWNRSHKNIELRWLVKCSRCLVERRSKGKVYTGNLRTTNQPVTLRKVYLDITNAGYDDGVPTSILREISFLKEITHENISSMVKAEVVGKVVYVCTEQGEYNLKEYMKKFYVNDGYTVSKATVQSLMKQVFTGLQFIHSRGIIHRNLKPDNVLVSSSGTVKLADFTLSRMECVPRSPYTPEDPKERERSGREARRLWYRAPELLLREDLYGSEVDVWGSLVQRRERDRAPVQNLQSDGSPRISPRQELPLMEKIRIHSRRLRKRLFGVQSRAQHPGAVPRAGAQHPGQTRKRDRSGRPGPAAKVS